MAHRARRFRGRALVVTLVELPLVLPPAVAGIGLLAAVGTGGLFGSDAARRGASSCPSPRRRWSWPSPSWPRPSTSARRSASFEAVDPNLTDAARTLGAGPARTFWRIGLPLAAGGLLAGWVLAFARGVGEFGATIIFAGNVRGQTQTLTLTIYEQLESNLDVALAIGVLLVVLSGGVLLSYKMLSSWRRSSSTSPSPFARSSSASSLSIERETVALVGPSGAGKTTVLRGHRRPAAPRPRAHRARRPRLVRRARPRSTCRPSAARSASSSRSTRCSRT